MDFFEGPVPRLFAHRGASGELPENTIAAMRAGIEAGADRIETDVHGTADGEVVVFHDATLERTTDGKGSVKDRTLAELRSLDAGFTFSDGKGGHPFRDRGIVIPTLAEVFEEFPGVPVNIEIKQLQPELEAAVLAVIDEHDARGRVLLAAEDDRIMARIRKVAPGIATGFPESEARRFYAHCHGEPADRSAFPGKALQVPPRLNEIEVIDAAFVDQAHDLGLEVHAWTINDPAEAERLIALGVDGIMSDFPARIAPVLGR